MVARAIGALRTRRVSAVLFARDEYGESARDDAGQDGGRGNRFTGYKNRLIWSSACWPVQRTTRRKIRHGFKNFTTIVSRRRGV